CLRKQLLLRHGKTRTETAVGSDAISPSQYNKTTASDFTEETKDRCGGTKVRHPQGQLAAGAPRAQGDDTGTESQTVTSPGVWRDKILKGQDQFALT
ncbi:hypothetical protein A4X13_0g9610, partial [Tilletia indica]